MKRGLPVFLAVIGAILLLSGSIQLYNYVHPAVPPSGTWRNDELQLTIHFTKSRGITATAVKDGKTIQCDGNVRFHSSVIALWEIEDRDGHRVEIEHYLTIECIRRTKDKLTVRESETGKKYVFYLVPEDDGS